MGTTVTLPKRSINGFHNLKQFDLLSESFGNLDFDERICDAYHNDIFAPDLYL